MSKAPVVSDPAILGGTPVFNGTRIPVHLIASMLNRGESVQELEKHYPSLEGRDLSWVQEWARENPEPVYMHPWHEEAK